MRKKIRCEIILSAIIGRGTKAEKDSAWRYLRSVSARAEADIVNASRLSQNDVATLISKAKATDIKKYNTQGLIQKVNTVLSRLVADCEVLARRLVIANVLSGKVKAILNVKLESDKLATAIALVDADFGRIDKMVMDIVNGVRRGVSLSMASVNTFIQRVALKANAPVPLPTKAPVAVVIPKKGKDKKDDKGKKEQLKVVKQIEKTDNVKQMPMPKEFSGAQIDVLRARRVYIERLPTQDELNSIRANPSAFTGRAIRENVSYVNHLRSDYRKEVNRQPDKKQTEKELSIIRKGKDAHAKEVIYEAGNNLMREGLFAFVDKGGKRWTLMNYCSMMAHTVSTQSTNIGDLYADEAHDLYYIVPHSHSCPICHKVEGKVYSRSGTSKKYPPLASVFPKIDPMGTDDLSNRYFSIHPNCRHVIVKYNGK